LQKYNEWFGRPGLLLCGLGGLVCCCVAWVAWSSSFFKWLSNYQSPKRKNKKDECALLIENMSIENNSEDTIFI